jgi:general stress protein YciG
LDIEGPELVLDTYSSTKSRRGFAGMDPDKRREIAARDGAAVLADKRGFFKSRELAASADRVGGSSGRARTHD